MPFSIIIPMLDEASSLSCLRMDSFVISWDTDEGSVDVGGKKGI